MRHTFLDIAKLVYRSLSCQMSVSGTVILVFWGLLVGGGFASASDFGILNCTSRKYAAPTDGPYFPKSIEWREFGRSGVDCAYSPNGKFITIVQRQFEAKHVKAIIASDTESRTVSFDVDGAWIAGLGVGDSGDLYILSRVRGTFGLLRVRYGESSAFRFVAMGEPSESDWIHGYCGSIQILGDSAIVDGRSGRIVVVTNDGKVTFLEGERYCPAVSHDGLFLGYVRNGSYYVENLSNDNVEFVIARKSIGRWHPLRNEIVVRSDCNELVGLWCKLLLYREVLDVALHARKPLLLFYSVENDRGLLWATRRQAKRVVRGLEP